MENEADYRGGMTIDDGVVWTPDNRHFNELGLPYTVPPWNKHFPREAHRRFSWKRVRRMSGLELLQHFTTRFNPTNGCARISLRQVVYRCNLISACRREFSGLIGVQKAVKHLCKHLLKMEEHRKRNVSYHNYIESLVFYAVGDQFPAGITVGSRHSNGSYYQDGSSFQGPSLYNPRTRKQELAVTCEPETMTEKGSNYQGNLDADSQVFALQTKQISCQSSNGEAGTLENNMNNIQPLKENTNWPKTLAKNAFPGNCRSRYDVQGSSTTTVIDCPIERTSKTDTNISTSSSFTSCGSGQDISLVSLKEISDLCERIENETLKDSDLAVRSNEALEYPPATEYTHYESSNRCYSPFPVGTVNVGCDASDIICTISSVTSLAYEDSKGNASVNMNNESSPQPITEQFDSSRKGCHTFVYSSNCKVVCHQCPMTEVTQNELCENCVTKFLDCETPQRVLQEEYVELGAMTDLSAKNGVTRSAYELVTNRLPELGDGVTDHCVLPRVSQVERAENFLMTGISDENGVTLPAYELVTNRVSELGDGVTDHCIMPRVSQVEHAENCLMTGISDENGVTLPAYELVTNRVSELGDGVTDHCLMPRVSQVEHAENCLMTGRSDENGVILPAYELVRDGVSELRDGVTGYRVTPRVDTTPVLCEDYEDHVCISDDYPSLLATFPIQDAEIASPPNVAPITSQGTPVSQSKYGELLAVIEELGKDIRPTYAGSKNASERLKKGIMHARALVRECLIETERCARQ